MEPEGLTRREAGLAGPSGATRFSAGPSDLIPEWVRTVAYLVSGFKVLPLVLALVIAILAAFSGEGLLALAIAGSITAPFVFLPFAQAWAVAKSKRMQLIVAAALLVLVDFLYVVGRVVSEDFRPGMGPNLLWIVLGTLIGSAQIAVLVGAIVAPQHRPRMGGSGEEGVLVEVRDLKKHFPIRKGLFRRQVGAVRAVDGVNLQIFKGETLGLVGESGSGKSTAGRSILQLENLTDGAVIFDGEDIGHLSSEEVRLLRPRMQMVFQNPHASLNPRMTVASIIGEPLREHGAVRGQERRDRIDELLQLVGLDPSHANRYPHEFSGGQRQRIGIARAIALNPDFIVCDEPIAALDVSIQAQVVNLLERLQNTLDLTYLFISHDLSMVRHIADRVAVMYLGKIVELAETAELFDNPRHPYTKALHSAVPVPDPAVEATRERVILVGDIPSPTNPPSGCVFHTRCPIAEDRCSREAPEWRQTDGHWVACHLVD